ncbi:MAG: class I SAM-dependent methyltransferase, partial [Patescibacteria group bacterium]|nr:class I SAM-dependent methyltransferase [Patescibacteria group bacterium]
PVDRPDGLIRPVMACPGSVDGSPDVTDGGPDAVACKGKQSPLLGAVPNMPADPVRGHQVQRYYTGDLGRGYHGDRHSIPEEAYLWVARQRARKFMSVVTSDSIVLEYGVGTGWNLALLQCKQRLGYDVADFLASQVRAHGVTFVADTKSLVTGSVDVVICHHTLEHLAAPFCALSEMHRLLRSGGTLWLSVPYDVRSDGRRFYPADPHHHLYSWNVQTLANLVQEVGFKVEQAGLGRFGYDRLAASTSLKLKLSVPGYRIIWAILQALRPVHEVRLVAKAE